jgi:hypothetical protein
MTFRANSKNRHCFRARTQNEIPCYASKDGVLVFHATKLCGRSQQLCFDLYFRCERPMHGTFVGNFEELRARCSSLSAPLN